MCTALLSRRVHGEMISSTPFARSFRSTPLERRCRRRRMCQSSSRSSKFLQGWGASAMAAPQSASDNLMSSPTLISSPEWPGRLFWFGVWGVGTRYPRAAQAAMVLSRQALHPTPVGGEGRRGVGSPAWPGGLLGSARWGAKDAEVQRYCRMNRTQIGASL